MPPENMLWLISSIFLAVISFLKAMQGPQRIGAFAVGTAMSAVNEDPPMLRRSTVTVLCTTAPNALDTRSAASSSEV